jgi:hypothetical protein
MNEHNIIKLRKDNHSVFMKEFVKTSNIIFDLDNNNYKIYGPHNITAGTILNDTI